MRVVVFDRLLIIGRLRVLVFDRLLIIGRLRVVVFDRLLVVGRLRVFILDRLLIVRRLRVLVFDRFVNVGRLRVFVLDRLVNVGRLRVVFDRLRVIDKRRGFIRGRHKVVGRVRALDRRRLVGRLRVIRFLIVNGIIQRLKVATHLKMNRVILRPHHAGRNMELGERFHSQKDRLAVLRGRQDNRLAFLDIDRNLVVRVSVSFVPYQLLALREGLELEPDKDLFPLAAQLIRGRYGDGLTLFRRNARNGEIQPQGIGVPTGNERHIGERRVIRFLAAPHGFHAVGIEDNAHGIGDMRVRVGFCRYFGFLCGSFLRG